MELKDILKKLRSEHNVSQVELAERVGVASSTVAMWEVGKRFPTREKYEALADIFNVDIDYLYGRTNIRQSIHFDGDGNPMVHLSTDEHRLIDDYRQLSSTGQEYIMQTMAMAVSTYSKDLKRDSRIDMEM